MKKIMIVMILFAVVTLAAEDLPEFSFCGSLSSFWNEGWKEKFFFQTLSQQEFESGHHNFNHTLRHTMYANPEIWYNIMLSDKFALSLGARYEYMNINLVDSVLFSWMIQHKQLNGSLNFYSFGGKLQWISRVHPYVGFSMGYCYGNLTTDHVYEAPDVFITKVNVKGDGGGLFYDIIMGINVPMIHKTSLFFEGDIRFTPGWKRFDSDDVHVEDMDDRVQWLLTEDRRLDRLIGWVARLGVQIGIM